MVVKILEGLKIILINVILVVVIVLATHQNLFERISVAADLDQVKIFEEIKITQSMVPVLTQLKTLKLTVKMLIMKVKSGVKNIRVAPRTLVV